MNEFIRFYTWGIKMKFHMAIYTLALIATNGFVKWLMGERSITIPTLLEMMLVCFAIALLETWIFPEEGIWEGSAMVRRTVLWSLVCNTGFIGWNPGLDWFSGIPGWAAIVLLLFLEGGLAAMWFAMHVALKKDTEQLNQKLQLYKNGN
ncbi:hypothetical protein [Hungatella sp.]|uniref:hypothetical protein n=1 Tax=Hungatella sp. TaxID=2613924 RepID=UPI0039947BD8